MRTVDDGLAELRAGLAELGSVSWPHRAPFLMTDLGSEALPVVWELFRRGIYVQDGAGWGLPTFPPHLGRPLRAPPGAAGSASGDPGRLRGDPLWIRPKTGSS